MGDVTYYRTLNGVKYLDEKQDEAFARSTLHGNPLLEAESRLPVRDVEAQASEAEVFLNGMSKRRICLSGAWRMKDCEPAFPGDPAPATGWFGRKAKTSPGMEERWYEPGYDRSSWREVQVPTTVQSALLTLGELEDPLWDTNTIDELEAHGEPRELPVWFRRTRVECRDWWFAKSFEVPAAWQGKRLTLRFDGIDYSGTVFLNGMSLGHHKGMFGGPELDVTTLIHYGGTNELVVRIDQAPQSWNGLLKGSPGFGWHYGHLISMGIWKDVWLTAEPAISIADPYVATRSIEAGEAKLRIEYAVNSRLARQASVIVAGEIRRQGAEADEDEHPLRFRNELVVGYGLSKWRTEMTIPDPAVWWPLGYGDQSLYSLTLELSQPNEQDSQVPEASEVSEMSDVQESANAQVCLDTAELTFGIRTIEMRPLPGSLPEADYRWQFVINGVPMFIKGANWCWPDPMLEQQEAKYERLLELARRANVQMLRAWGGGIIEPDFFYRMCDEKGIMVYQEFPFCWGPMDAPQTDLYVIDSQVTRTVKRLRNHPSLIMWGGGNENGPHGGADEGLFLAGRRCRQFDPSRPYHRTDPWGGSVHNWNVYHGGEPLDAATRAMPSVMMGEFGIPSMTNRSSILKYMPETALGEFPPTEESRGWKAHFHQFSLKDPIKVMRYGAYGPITSWDAYIAYSQTAQGESIRYTADMQRAGAGATTSGFWYYKFTDLFPGHSWAVVDYYGTPKLSYYRAMQACRPQSAFAVYEKIDGWLPGESFTASLYAANETMEEIPHAKVSAVLYSSRLQALWSQRYDGITLAANSVLALDQLHVPLGVATEIAPFLLAVSLRAEDGTLFADQWYWFNAQPKSEELLAFEQAHTHHDNEYPGDLAAEAFRRYAGLTATPLAQLPVTQLEGAIECHGAGGTIRVRNVGAYPAIRVTLDGFPEAWDCYLADNDFGLYPGEERAIGFEAGSGQSLVGLSLGGWNTARITLAQS